MPKFYLTTPIYYVNDKPHIGSTYTTVVADALARFHRARNEDVCFVTGTDENSQKNLQAMEKAGDADLQSYLDRMALTWQTTWKDFEISLDDFIRTTEARHLKGVERFWNAVLKSGDIEKRSYEGMYCVGCEGFKTETELSNGRCPLHPNKELELLKEENYFFCLTRYREALLALYANDATFVMPEARRNEIRNYVADFMTDISISRESKKLSVGIPVPGDDSQRIYVWFDALLSYMTAVGYGSNDELFSRFWPADLHLVGKDIIKFHCALWPAMILSAAKNDALLREADGRVKLPKQVFAHGFLTSEGQKMSKSIGNVVDPHELVATYGLDGMRYFLLREIPFGEDGDFSRARLADRYQSDLGNTYGNLVNRAIAMSKKYFDGKVPPVDSSSCERAEMDSAWGGREGLERLRDAVQAAYEGTRCDLALDVIWQGAQHAHRSGLIQANKYVEETQPFKLVKTDPEAVGRILYALLEACRWYAWLTLPVMPRTSRRVFEQLGLNADEELAKGWESALVWGGLKAGASLGDPEPLFPRMVVGE